MGAVKVYGLAVSVHTARVLATLEELGVHYELVPVDGVAGETMRPAYLSLNPFAQIPALEDGHLTLFESRAISRYIARKYKNTGADLLKVGDREAAAAAVDVWMEVEAQHYDPAISVLVQQIIDVSYFGATPDADLLAKNVACLERVLDVYEERLSKSKYLAGDYFSLADLHHLPYTLQLMRSPAHASLINSRPKVKAWWEELTSRPACKRVADAMNAAAATWKSAHLGLP